MADLMQTDKSRTTGQPQDLAGRRDETQIPTPDTTIGGDIGGTAVIETTDDIGIGSQVRSAQDEAAEDRAERRDDPLSQTGTYEGKKVFRANELNQAGEDKEYFHPNDHHRFKVPQDAQHHVLRPDVTLTPGDHPNIEVKDRK